MTNQVTGSAALQGKEIEKLARKYADESGNVRVVVESRYDIMREALQWLLRDHCIVSKDFVKKQRLVIEFDKKQMLEKPTGERMALAGVYQAKLELIEKLFGTDLFKNDTDNEN